MGASLIVAGCGSGDDEAPTQTFGDDDFGITFEYPANLQPGTVDSMARSTGGASARTVLVLEPDNGIIVTKFSLDRPVPRGGLTPEIVDEMNGVVTDLAGRPEEGVPVEVAGLPAIRYDAVELTEPKEGLSRFLILIDGDVQYQLNCQSTPPHRDAINEACDQVFATVKPR